MRSFVYYSTGERPAGRCNLICRLQIDRRRIKNNSDIYAAGCRHVCETGTHESFCILFEILTILSKILMTHEAKPGHGPNQASA
jgi:hypothetical protein